MSSLQSLMVGPVAIDGRVILAPMSGITDAPFRAAARALGAPAVVCEMIASRDLSLKRPETMRRAMGHQRGGARDPLIIQLAGREAGMMAEGARIAADLGADIIDINMGCPAKKVTGGYSGAALMREPGRALGLIEAVVSATPLPVTVKMRLGWCDASRNAPELARRAESAGAALITVHGRTRCQFYDGRADWPAIAEVKQAVTVPVIANGDLTAIGDADDMLRMTGADAVMIGRGAQGRPWFPGQVAHYLATGEVLADPDPASEHEIIRAHYEEMLTHYGRELGARCARKHLGWALDRHAGAVEAVRAWRRAICTETEPSRVIARLGGFYDLLGERAAA